jgi:hypothetical protein
MIHPLPNPLSPFKNLFFGNAPSNSSHGPSPKIKVLVVEDDIPIDIYLNRIHDIQAIRVVSAQDGLDAFQSYQPDVVLLDETLEGGEKGSSLFPKLLSLGAKASQFICISGLPPAGIYEPHGVPVYGDKNNLISEIGNANRAKREGQQELPTPIWDRWLAKIRELASPKT